MHLADILSIVCAARLYRPRKSEAEGSQVVLTPACIRGAEIAASLGIFAFLDPSATQSGQSPRQIDFGFWICIWAGSIIDRYWSVLFEAITMMGRRQG